MTMFRWIAVLGIGLLAAASAEASCYIVVNPKGDVLSQTSTPPVDMALPLHQTVPVRFGSGAHMMFGVDEPDCGPAGDPYARSTGALAGGRGTVMNRRAPRAPKADRG